MDYPEDKEAAIAVARVAPANHTAVLEGINLEAKGEGQWRQYAHWLKLGRQFDDDMLTRHALGTREADVLLQKLNQVEKRWPNSNDREFARWKGSLLFDAGDYVQAESYLAAACRRPESKAAFSETNIRTAMLLCEAALVQGRIPAAATYFDEFLAPHADMVEVALLRARIWKKVAVSRTSPG